ncbi:MAG: hypothetical protein JJE50_15825 [Actinomycetales bacterium]|nr:hypothetical protein [Actinomycetales bacterium]
MTGPAQEHTSGEDRSPSSDVTDEEQLAFRHVAAFARNVALQLVAARVPEDEYAVQEARLGPRKEPFGFHALGDDVILNAAERRDGIGGWRVTSAVAQEVTRVGRSGAPDAHAYQRVAEELWLGRGGDLRSVRLTTDASGATTVEQAPLTAEDALRLDRSTQWHETTRKEHGTTWREGRREASSEREVPGPCDRVSDLLAVLLRRAY